MATARRAAFSSLARLAPTTILEDATVPRSELARMVAKISVLAALSNGAARELVLDWNRISKNLAVPPCQPAGAGLLQAGVADQGSDGESRFGHGPLRRRDDPREWPPNVDERKA